jgi:hypothetical protein
MYVEMKTRLMVGGCLLLLVVSTTVNVLQAQRIQTLLVATKGGASTIGTEAIPIIGVTVAGERTTVMFKDRRPTVLYYFSPTCGWCERNWANIQALHDGAEGRYRVIAVSSERGLADYVRRHDVAVDVIEGISENVRTAYGFYGTPHTVVVDVEGVVTHEWRGAFSPRISRQIEELFGLRLPGVQAATAGNARD